MLNIIKKVTDLEHLLISQIHIQEELISFKDKRERIVNYPFLYLFLYFLETELP